MTKPVPPRAALFAAFLSLAAASASAVGLSEKPEQAAPPLPQPPVITEVTEVTSGQVDITLKWTPSDEHWKFYLYRQGDGGRYEQVTPLMRDDFSASKEFVYTVSDSKVEPGKTYTYYVFSALPPFYELAASILADDLPAQPQPNLMWEASPKKAQMPPLPAFLGTPAVINPYQVRLSVDTRTFEPDYEYFLYRSGNADSSSFKLVKVLPSESMVIDDVLPGGTYRYQLAYVRKGTKVPVVWQAAPAHPFAPVSLPPLPIIRRPTTPGVGSVELTLEWRPVPEAGRVYYGIYAAAENQPVFRFRQQVAPGQKSAIVGGLEPGVTYQFVPYYVTNPGDLFADLPQPLRGNPIEGKPRELPVETRVERVGGRPEGLYVGITAFGAGELAISEPVLLDSDAAVEALIARFEREYALSAEPGRTLYFGVHKALANIAAAQESGRLPADLGSITLVTITGGEDTASAAAGLREEARAFPEKLRISEEARLSAHAYAEFLQRLIAGGSGGVKIDAWALGLAEADQADLVALAGGTGHALRFAEASDLRGALAGILEAVRSGADGVDRSSLIVKTTTYGQGTELRIELDAGHSVSGSVEITDEGVYYLRGITSDPPGFVEADSVRGQQEGRYQVSYELALKGTFAPGRGRLAVKSAAGQFKADGDSEAEVRRKTSYTRKTALLYLALDRSRALGANLADVRAAVRETLNGQGTPASLAAVSSPPLPPAQDAAQPAAPERAQTAPPEWTAPAAQPSPPERTQLPSPPERAQAAPQPAAGERAQSAAPPRPAPAYANVSLNAVRDLIARWPAALSEEASRLDARGAWPTQDLAPDETVTSAGAALRWWVQLGAYSEEARANRILAILRTTLSGVYTWTKPAGENARYKVRVGPFATRAAAQQAATLFRSM